MSRFTNPVPQFFHDDGSVASSGRMHFFENKNYSVRKDTFALSDNTVKNTNPVKLDGQGRMPPCHGEGLYSVKFYAANPDNPDIDGALQWTRDDVSLSELSSQFELWIAAETYTINDIAKDPSDGNYYQLYGAPTSKGEQPSASLTKWELVYFLTGFNPNKTYNLDQIVVDGGFIYRSLEDDNEDTPPSAKWANLTFNDSIAGNFDVGGNLVVSGTVESASNLFAIRTTIKSVASQATPQIDNDLIIENIPAGIYHVRGHLSYSGNGTTANGISVNLVVAAGGSIRSLMITGANNTPGTPAPADSEFSIGTAFRANPSTGGPPEPVVIDAIVQSSGGSTFRIDWAQQSSNVISTTVTYAFISATRIN